MLSLIQRATRVKTSTMKAAESSDSTVDTDVADLKEFPLFAELNEDLCHLILAFVADAPLEQRLPGPIAQYKQASLTEYLPLVNKRFHYLSNLDYYWEPALMRQLRNKVWREGLTRLLPDGVKVGKGTDLLSAVRQQVGEEISCKVLYRSILTQHIQFTGPIFLMPCHLRLGEMYGLHLFEPRYRIMIQDVMENCENPEEAKRGGKIREKRVDGISRPPLLIHACQGSRICPGEKVCLVQVVWCHTYEYGTADVRLLPVAWVKLDKIWMRPSSGHLFYAKASRILQD
jgi:hypothetical protein